jgi:hypothetical protein
MIFDKNTRTKTMNKLISVYDAEERIMKCSHQFIKF